MSATALAQRAAGRRANTVRIELQRGIPSLATIAATAALWGLAGTAWGMANSFLGGSYSHSSLLAHIMNRFAGALLFNAWGLLLALTALAAHNILSRQLEQCETEMALAISLLPDALRPSRNEVRE